MNKNKLILLIFGVIGLSLLNMNNLKSQCSIDNRYFQSGEDLEYDLYIKLGFAVTKGGEAKLQTQAIKYNGKDAYKMNLVSETQGMAKKLFSLSDTLIAYTSKDITPLAYTKDAHEGGDYTKEKLTYTYPGDGTVKIKTVRHKDGEFKFDEEIVAPNCTYDLVSILFYCRTLNFANMSKGSTKTVNFISGKKRGSMKIEHNGTENIKANDGKKYNCIKLTLYIADEAFDDGKEAMKVYVTNDENRTPIKLETKLKVGSTRAILKSYKGNKYPLSTAK